MDAIISAMYLNTTLLGTFVFVGALAYVGTVGISPSNIPLRRAVGYLTGALMVVVGVFALYFGADKLLVLLFNHVYLFDLLHIEWTILGLLAIIVGLLLVRQAFRRM